LVERSDLFKISNLVYEGREIVRSQYSSLQGQTVYGRYSELAGSQCISGRFNGLRNCVLLFLGTIDVVDFDSFGYLKSY
jgi:hypothetical protein